MVMTNAERQRRFRQARKTANDGAGEQQLNNWIRMEAYFGLQRLAAHYGVTQREMLERLIQAADEAIIEGLEPGSEEWEVYFQRQGQASA